MCSSMALTDRAKSALESMRVPSRSKIKTRTLENFFWVSDITEAKIDSNRADGIGGSGREFGRGDPGTACGSASWARERLLELQNAPGDQKRPTFCQLAAS